MFRLVLGLCLILNPVLNAQSKNGDDCARAVGASGNPVIELSGIISQVHIGAGQGTSYISVRTGSAVTRLHLGAVHYLIARDFNPKSGEQVSARAYNTADGAVALQVTLVSEKKNIRLRDENGRPLWRAGQRRSGAPNPAGR